ncbi:MAG TPA: N-6 DNA methylase, partial [Spirochaetia bacterium]
MACVSSGVALTADALASDFSPRSTLTLGALDALRHRLDDALAGGNTVTEAMFAQWRSAFGRSTGRPSLAGGARSPGMGARGDMESLAGGAGSDTERALFCLHTFFAFLLKTVAWRVLSRDGLDGFASFDPAGVRARLAKLESGGAFEEHGIAGLLDGDVFSWYLDVWEETVAVAFRDVASRISRYEPTPHDGASGLTRDLFKRLYRLLLPRGIRHDLGEYYTPDWLARRALSLLDPRLFGDEGAAGLRDRLRATRILDPSCGSGTFLLEIIARWETLAERIALPPGELLHVILANLVGLDLNPLAVLTARVNVLVSIARLLRHRRGTIAIPVFRADTVRLPVAADDPSSSLPAAAGKFDLVAGNPPWITWDSLPAEYRSDLRPVWERYGLFPHCGMDTILGKGKKDISMLMTYVVADRLLKDGGRLAFVMTQSVFKTSGAGQGFRRFAIPGPSGTGTPLGVTHVDDMTDLNPFPGASNRTAIVLLEKGISTRYPVRYVLWRRKRAPAGADAQGAFTRDSALDEVMNATERHDTLAEPVDPEDSTSAWLTGRRETVAAVRRYLGPSDYDAHLGANTGGANAVYWLDALGRRDDGLVVVRNIRDGAKIPVETVTRPVEEP